MSNVCMSYCIDEFLYIIQPDLIQLGTQNYILSNEAWNIPEPTTIRAAAVATPSLYAPVGSVYIQNMGNDYLLMKL